MFKDSDFDYKDADYKDSDYKDSEKLWITVYTWNPQFSNNSRDFLRCQEFSWIIAGL